LGVISQKVQLQLQKRNFNCLIADNADFAETARILGI
jgi:hypothetical protein